MAFVGPNPQNMVCPYCHAQIQTHVEHRATAKTHLIAIILCLVIMPCACIPYFVDSCKNTNHYCPNCHAFIGTYQS